MNVTIADNTFNQYQITLFDIAGKNIFTKAIQHVGGNTVYQIQLPATIQSGKYFVQTTVTLGTKETKMIFID